MHFVKGLANLHNICSNKFYICPNILHPYPLASSIPVNSTPFQLARAGEKIHRDLWEFFRALLTSSIWEREPMFPQWIFTILYSLSHLPFPSHERSFSKHSILPFRDLWLSGWCWESLESNTTIPRELGGLLPATPHAYSEDKVKKQLNKVSCE